MRTTKLAELGLHDNRTAIWLRIERIEMVDGDQIVAVQRETLYPHRDLATQLAAIDGTLARDGFDPIGADDVQAIFDFVELATDDGALIPPAPEPEAERVAPPAISDRQFAHGLAKRGLISQAEALAFVQTGAVPSALQSFIDGLPTDEARFDAAMLLSGATSFERDHPITVALLDAYGWDEAEADAFWLYCGAL